MDTLLIQPENLDQLNALKAILKALKVNYKIQKEKSPYDPKFVEKIRASEADVRAGRVKSIKTEDLWK